MFRICIGFFAYCWMALGFATHLNYFNIQSSRVEMRVDSIVSPKVFKLTQPNRLVIDLPHTRLGSHLAHFMRIGNYQIRFGEHGSEYLRVVIESPQLQGYQVVPIRANGSLYSLISIYKIKVQPQYKPLQPRHPPIHLYL
jgi:hypothetical protein